MNYGFVKVAAAVPHVKVADCKFNVEKIESLIAVAEGKGVQIILFPMLLLNLFPLLLRNSSILFVRAYLARVRI